MGHPHLADPSVPELRAKAVVRRAPVSWSENDGVWEATIGRWSARVTLGVDGKSGWEWRAFSAPGYTGDEAVRALGGRGWREREDAQRDAESALAARA